MGYTTSIPEPELERGDGPPPCEGVDIEAARAKENPAPEKHPVTKSKVIEGDDKPESKKSTARTKSK
jgi:hypothetical protein